MKGTIYKGNAVCFKDEKTGAEVKRLTDNTGDSYHPYFTQQLIGLDNKTVLALSNRTGSQQLFTLDLDNGDMLQLTDIATNERIGQPVLDITNNVAYFFVGRTLTRVRIGDLETEELMELPTGFHLTDLSITNKGDYLAFTYAENLQCITQSGVIYSNMRETLFRRPSSVVVRYDTVQKKPYVVWGEREWISHTNISPVDPDLILFCHEGSWHLVQRMWMAKVSTDEVWPLVEQKRLTERVGHEFFTASGRIATQYTYRNSVNEEWFFKADIFLNPDGTDEKRYYYPYPAGPNHFQMNYAEDMGVGDGACVERGMKDVHNYISLLKYEGNRVIVGLLCKHGSSWLQQHNHPHPIFTRDDKHVVFSTDMGGVNNVYIAEADWDKCLKSE